MTGTPWDPCSGLDAASIGPRCLVTGSAGYLGRHLVRALLRLGCSVRALDVVPSEEDGVETIVGDVRDRALVRAACEDIDTVFHCAAVLTLLGVARDAVKDHVFSVNVGGTDAVIEGCRHAGVGRLVYVSSANVAIDRERIEADESVGYATTFVDLYGESKVLAERAVLAANSVALRTMAVRPGGIWGPGAGGFMIETFLAQLVQERFVATIGDGEAVVDNTHVDNVIRGMLLGADKLVSAPDTVGGSAYFITDDERVNGIEWFRPIVDGLGYTFPTTALPGAAMYAVGYASELARYLGGPDPALTRIGVLKLIRASAFRIDRARQDLGYTPLVQRDAGLAHHMSDYRRHARAIRVGGGAREAALDGAGKRVFLLWDRQERSRPARREAVVDRIGQRLVDDGADALSVLVADEGADMASPNPFPQRGPDPVAMVNVWVADDEAAERALETCRAEGFDVHGYRVEPSVYTDYGENEHASPRDWADGERSPGITALSLLKRPARLDRKTWIRRWHSRMSPISARIQPRTRYVRNLSLRALTDGAPPFEGIVEEAWPSPRHVTDPNLFYGATGPLSLVKNMATVGMVVSSFLDMWAVRTVMMSEYFVRTPE
ncbi:MAG: NAD-dependent epimerase/dehydratase family protein [Sandaracinaceae bacterium]